MGVISFRFRYSDCLRRKMFQPHDYIMLLHFYDVSTDVPLPDFLSLPSASYTRQSPWRQKGLCRLPLLGHSAKGLPRANSTRQICHVGAAGDGAFAECLTAGTRQRSKCCRVPGFGTRQSFGRCRVSNFWHSAKLLFQYTHYSHFASVFPYALGKVTKFFIFMFQFSLFFDTNTTKIYLNT